MPHILIIDDDEDLFSLLKEYLKDDGFSCTHAFDSEDGMEKIDNGSFDAVILDVMLPGINGFEILRCIRANEKNAALPILMLTARGEEIDRVVGLEMGADDYLGKPFNPRELTARIKAILRRAIPIKIGASSASLQQVEDIKINPSSLCVLVQGAQKELSMSELRLLTHLVENPGQMVSRDFLYKSLFGHQAYPRERSLDMLMSRLRRKLGPRPDGGERIKAVRGEGYMYLLSGKGS